MKNRYLAWYHSEKFNGIFNRKQYFIKMSYAEIKIGLDDDLPLGKTNMRYVVILTSLF